MAGTDSDRKSRLAGDSLEARECGEKSPGTRRWRLWQVETSFACNLACVMCPWKGAREQAANAGLMDGTVWAALRPHLKEVVEIDFSGGGEPLLHPRLLDWAREAGQAGCRTGFLSNGSLLDEAVAATVIDAGVDWVALSADGARADTFESIRQGARFEPFCQNVRRLTDMRSGKVPRVMFNFVMMPSNIDQLQDFVRLAVDLGVDQVNFKQCDVIRQGQERKLGLFASETTRDVRRFQKNLAKARKLAHKLGVDTTAYGFVPDEWPVCDQDPRTSLFIRHDGRAAPCINLATGGPSSFLGEAVVLPTVHYGVLPDEELATLWESPTCRSLRERFQQRVDAYERELGRANFEPSWIKLQELFETARAAMPEAPQGCHVCHYLYGI